MKLITLSINHIHSLYEFIRSMERVNQCHFYLDLVVGEEIINFREHHHGLTYKFKCFNIYGYFNTNALS